MKTISELESLIQSEESGISLAEILTRYPERPRRSIQRWLKRLVESDRIYPQGNARARRYYPAHMIPNHSRISKNQFPDYIPISADSQDIVSYIARPLASRNPVGYQAEFLESYIPNESAYLSETLRNQLQKMGNTRHSQLPAGTYGREILDRLLIDLSWASSQLEGNTYSYLDTRQLIQDGKTAQGKTALETQMILNHKSAIELLIENIEVLNFNHFTILNLHSALSENLLPNPSDEGRIRNHIVQISHSTFRPLTVPSQIDEYLTQILEKANQINNPFEQSFFMMVHIPYLQPFADLNKRTSRLAANLPLIRENLCPLTFLDVPEEAYTRAILGVYELTRVELLRDLFVWAYERSTQELLAIKQDLVEPDPIRLKYRGLMKDTINQVVVNNQKEPLKIIKKLVSEQVKVPKDCESVEAMIIEELRRLHEGVLARYGIRPSEYQHWKNQQINL